MKVNFLVSKEEFSKYVMNLLEKDESCKNVNRLSVKYLIVAISILVISVIILARYFFRFVVFYRASDVIILIAGVILFSVAVVMIKRRKKSLKYYRENYREKVLGYLLKDYNFYFNKSGWPFSWEFEHSQFVKSFDMCSSSDYLEINIPENDGSLSKVDFKLCDLYAYNIHRDEEGNVSTSKVYKGMFGYAKFPRKFKCVLSVGVNFKRKNIKMENVELENIVFNDKFKVKSNNQIEARYILTPKMMEKLLCLGEKFDNLKLIFVDSYLYIGAPDIDMFELQNLKNENVISMFENFYDEIQFVLNVVEEIKENDKVFVTSSKKRSKKNNPIN